MNPLPAIRADVRALGWFGAAMVALVAVSVALGVAVGCVERAARAASARAAADFDLLVGAPGPADRLVLAAVHLRLDALPAMDGAIVERLRADKGVAAVAPLAFGDIARGYPVVGATAEFATRWGRHPPAEGRLFAAEDEAVVGADVALALDDVVVPSHAPHAAAEAAHRHEVAGARVVGRLPRFGSAWDRAILVPIEAVWEVHGLGNGHAEDGRIGPPFDAARVPPVPIAVVRPASVADAYALRQRYRQDGTMAVFPAEVLSELHRLLGGASDAARWSAGAAQASVLAAIALLTVARPDDDAHEQRRSADPGRVRGGDAVGLGGGVGGVGHAGVARRVGAGARARLGRCGVRAGRGRVRRGARAAARVARLPRRTVGRAAALSAGLSRARDAMLYHNA